MCVVIAEAGVVVVVELRVVRAYVRISRLRGTGGLS